MPELPDRPGPGQPFGQERRSYGGAAPIEITDGTLFPDLLIVGPGRAILDARLAPAGQVAGRVDRGGLPGLDDLTVSDDRGARYPLRLGAMSWAGHEPGGCAGPAAVTAWLEPAPEPGGAWFELGNSTGFVTRLLPSPQAVVQVSDIAPVPANPAPAPADPAGNGLSELADAPIGAPPSAAERAGGAGLHLDLGVAVPALAGVATRIDSLVAVPDGWRLFLQASPGWFAYSADRHRKWTPVTAEAQDDLGGGYASEFGGSSGRDGREEVALTFAPGLDPRARTLTLTLRGGAAAVAVAVELPGTPDTGSPAERPGR
jgi:hypothetical protein